MPIDVKVRKQWITTAIGLGAAYLVYTLFESIIVAAVLAAATLWVAWNKNHDVSRKECMALGWVGAAAAIFLVLPWMRDEYPDLFMLPVVALAVVGFFLYRRHFRGSAKRIVMKGKAQPIAVLASAALLLLSFTGVASSSSAEMAVFPIQSGAAACKDINRLAIFKNGPVGIEGLSVASQGEGMNDKVTVKFTQVFSQKDCWQNPGPPVPVFCTTKVKSPCNPIAFGGKVGATCTVDHPNCADMCFGNPTATACKGICLADRTLKDTDANCPGNGPSTCWIPEGCASSVTKPSAYRATVSLTVGGHSHELVGESGASIVQDWMPLPEAGLYPAACIGKTIGKTPCPAKQEVRVEQSFSISISRDDLANWGMNFAVNRATITVQGWFQAPGTSSLQLYTGFSDTALPYCKVLPVAPDGCNNLGGSTIITKEYASGQEARVIVLSFPKDALTKTRKDTLQQISDSNTNSLWVWGQGARADVGSGLIGAGDVVPGIGLKTLGRLLT